MKTISEVLHLSAEFLGQKGIDRPRRQVEELLSHILKIPRIELYLQFDRPLDTIELDQLRLLLKKRAQRMPWQYIIGEVEFLGCFFTVTPDVLIPRSETEILVDRVIKELPTTPCLIWDLCCGSGCVGVSIKKKRPDCQLLLSDLSPQAIELAQKNADRNHIQVEIRQGDLMAAFPGRKVDVVISNPPYISKKEYDLLEPEVREWEPKMALVAGETGYEFYQRLSQEIPLHLNPQGKSYFEIGAGMGEEVKNLFLKAGWSSVEVSTDWSSHDRFVRACP